MFLENKLVIESIVIRRTEFSREEDSNFGKSRDDEDIVESGFNLNFVRAKQRSKGKNYVFEAYEFAGAAWDNYHTKGVLGYKDFLPKFFNALLINKSDLNGKKLKGDFVVLNRPEDYVIIGLRPSEEVDTLLEHYNRRNDSESFIYVPISKLRGIKC